MLNQIRIREAELVTGETVKIEKYFSSGQMQDNRGQVIAANDIKKIIKLEVERPQ